MGRKDLARTRRQQRDRSSRSAALAFYAAERDHNPKVNDVFDAMIYTSTCLSVGYGDIFAKTPVGKLLGTALMTYGPSLSSQMHDARPEPRDEVQEERSLRRSSNSPRADDAWGHRVKTPAGGSAILSPAMSDPVLQPPAARSVRPARRVRLARAGHDGDVLRRLHAAPGAGTLGEIGQWLPVDGDPDATLGSLIERNSTGPLRLGFGAWRDLLLGVQFTNGRGVSSSPPAAITVKNVAGYDLTKFIVGSFGVFGRLITFTARTYRKPDGAVLARFARPGEASTHSCRRRCRPQWAMLTREALLVRLPRRHDDARLVPVQRRHAGAEPSSRRADRSQKTSITARRAGGPMAVRYRSARQCRRQN